MVDLPISLIGPLEIRLDGEVRARFKFSKVRALLVYLAAEPGRSHSRSTLSGLLWPGYPQTSANQSLRQALKGFGLQVFHISGMADSGRITVWALC